MQHHLKELAARIDHTLLKPEATATDVELLCDEALKYGFASVCVLPIYVSLAVKHLDGSAVRVGTVIGFPLGATQTLVKALETRDAVAAGADELDMVMQIGALKAGDTEAVLADMRAVVQAAEGRVVKVILESSLLTESEIEQACLLAEQAGAHFVKTSTGFGSAGATEDDVALMRRTVGERLGVKASGGIRTIDVAQRMVQSGASRLGTSSGVTIVTSGTEDSADY